MSTTLRTIQQNLPKLLCAVAMALLLTCLAGCFAPGPGDNRDDTLQEPASGSNASKTTDDDDVIVAGTVDTSSNYSFSAQGAFVGMDEYTEEPEVILVCEFTNNSDDTISYGSALDAVAFQDGYELQTAYLRGASTYTYEKIEPGKTVSIFIGWKLQSATKPVKITVIDSRHYAKEVLFEQSYTIDELIENSLNFIEEYGGIVDENQDLSVST